MPSYEYVIPKGSFQLIKKGPVWFECKKEIMPKIEFYGELRGKVISSCTVDTKMGKANSDVKECISLVKNFFAKTKHPDAKLVYIVLGYKGDADKPWLNDLKNNLIKRYNSDRTVVGIVVWGKGARLLLDTGLIHYATAASNTWPIGNVLAYLNINIAKDIPNQKQLLTICIGHSLGAHLCGFFSKMLKRQEPKIQLDRIIGLDPAGQIFQNIYQDPTLRLEKDDALYTEIIHTNTKKFGFKNPIGHTDIYVNGGLKQPCCGKVTSSIHCSHQYAFLFMVELAKPLKHEQMQCTARWKCLFFSPLGFRKDKAYTKFKRITKEDEDKLQSAGCVKQNQNYAVRIGDLGIVSNMRKGVFWVEVGENSKTCKFSEQDNSN